MCSYQHKLPINFIKASMEQEITFPWLSITAIVFLAIGTIRMFCFLATVLASFFRKRLDLKKRYDGGWALVTGGSEGIGQAIAKELAKAGFNLVLVSRSTDKLNKARDTILAQYPQIKVEISSIDLAQLKNEEQYRKSFMSIFQRDISILVNNVGYYVPECFIQASYDAIRTEAKLNLIPIAAITSLFLQKASKRTAKTGLINLSSGAAMIVYKGTAHYSATKTYDDFFSRAINYELSPTTDVLTVRPFYVSTPMTKNIMSLTFCSAQQTGIEVVNALGNTSICYGPLLHRLNGALINLVNPALTTWTSSRSIEEFKKQYNKMN